MANFVDLSHKAASEDKTGPIQLSKDGKRLYVVVKRNSLATVALRVTAWLGEKVGKQDCAEILALPDQKRERASAQKFEEARKRYVEAGLVIPPAAGAGEQSEQCSVSSVLDIYAKSIAANPDFISAGNKNELKSLCFVFDHDSGNCQPNELTASLLKEEGLEIGGSQPDSVVACLFNKLASGLSLDKNQLFGAKGIIAQLVPFAPLLKRTVTGVSSLTHTCLAQMDATVGRLSRMISYANDANLPKQSRVAIALGRSYDAFVGKLRKELPHLAKLNELGRTWQKNALSNGFAMVAEMTPNNGEIADFAKLVRKPQSQAGQKFKALVSTAKCLSLGHDEFGFFTSSRDKTQQLGKPQFYCLLTSLSDLFAVLPKYLEDGFEVSDSEVGAILDSNSLPVLDSSQMSLRKEASWNMRADPAGSF